MKSFTSEVRDHIECLVLTPFLVTFSLSQYVYIQTYTMLWHAYSGACPYLASGHLPCALISSIVKAE